MSPPSHNPTPISVNAQGVAIDGYDPVAYVHLGKPVEGSPDVIRVWSGATWRFATEEHAVAFADSPAQYLPAFGGHCALAGGFGKSASASPRAWWVDEGRIYLAKDRFAALFARLMSERVSRAAASWQERLRGELDG